jgi:ribosome-binding protein aMBF1 (putative translation factor)
MDSVTKKRKRAGRGSHKPQPMTKAEMLQKMISDQKIIKEARQKGISYEQLEKEYGFRFARLSHL